MKGLIIAAGMGSRMRELTATIPKCLLKVNGKSILSRLVDNFNDCDIVDVCIIVGYKKELIKALGFRCFENDEYENNNILHSLFYAEEVMSEGFIFTYSDIVYDSDVIDKIIKSNSDISIAVDKDWINYYDDRADHPISQAELVFSDDGKTVSKIRKNSDHTKSFGEFLGVGYFSEKGAKILIEVFNELKGIYAESPNKQFHTADTFENAYMTDMLQELINRGYQVDIVKIDSNWAEIDIPRDYKVANELWKSK